MLTITEKLRIRDQLAAFGQPSISEDDLEAYFGPASNEGYLMRHLLDLASSVLDSQEQEGLLTHEFTRNPTHSAGGLPLPSNGSIARVATLEPIRGMGGESERRSYRP